ncbi:hypothetical protein ACFLV1_02540 [Chloroflexota bacterium]
MKTAQTDSIIAEQIEKDNIGNTIRYWVGYAGGPGHYADEASAIMSGEAHPPANRWYYPAIRVGFQAVTDRHGQLVGVDLESEKVVLSTPLGPKWAEPHGKNPESLHRAMEELNKNSPSQTSKEPNEPISTNSDNVSRREPTEEDIDALIARLAQNTYLPAEAFGIRALTDQEKADCIATASQHPSVSGFVSRGSEYIVGFQWIGLLPGGGYGVLPYDTVEKGVSSVLDWPQRATFYPAVGLATATYSYCLAVDLDKREVIYVTSGLIRKGLTTLPEK